MPETSSAFDRLLPVVEQIRERIEATPDDQPVSFTREEMLVIVELLGRMARGFQVLERRRLR